MLTQIHIANLATIEELHLDLLNGTTVITGETGAGKSILIDAIELALGERASAHLIRANQEKADIRLCFDLRGYEVLPEVLKNADFDHRNQECIIRRLIMRDGRSRTFLNDMPITLPALRALSESLVEIHGQHEHQSLLKPDKQRELLDRFGNHPTLLVDVANLAKDFHALQDKITEAKSSLHQRDERRDFLRYQLNELETLQLQPEEWAALEIEHRQLAHADTLLQNLTQAQFELSLNDENNVLKILHRVLKALETVSHVSPQIHNWRTAINTATIGLDDAANEITHYLESIELNPQRLQWVEQRMQSIHDAARKYKVNPGELLALQEKLAEELNSLESSESTIAELEKQLTLIQASYRQAANKLSDKRLKASKSLAKEITQTIKTLALPQAEFQVHLLMEGELHPNPHGAEKITFMVKTNQGSDFHPLAKIASGGELSRISLAIHLATAEQYSVPTLIFDEVDVGIGGGTAELVGQLLRRLGDSHQVLCITHLPQVAAYGEHHLFVEKKVQAQETATSIHNLNPAAKVKEIARMLGGVNITATTLRHAEEMVEGVLIQGLA